jgi:cell division protein FtsI (penicillin-binding protein 3)
MQQMGVAPVTDHATERWHDIVSTRLLIAAILFAAWAVAIEAQLVRMQVFQHDQWQLRADRQQSDTQKVPARRGDIVDRDGHVLATSVDADEIFAVPKVIQQPAATAAALCRALRGCTARERDVLTERLSHRTSNFAYVRRANHVLPEDASRVAALELPGIGFLKASRRAYPNNELAAHLLGFVGTDSYGLNGIEAAYNDKISGTDGEVLIQTDAKHRPFGSFGQAATPGSTLQLTIDQYLQHLAERELRAGVREHNAKGGSAVIMNPYTGEILAMANEPTFDPNRYNEASDLQRKNRAIQDVYEPGSTFKMVTASAALEEHVMTPDVPIDVTGGRLRIKGRARPVTDTHAYGVLSFTDVIVKSSNIGAIKIGQKLGAERLGRYVDRFGFGRRLLPDLYGESPGIVWDPARWNDSTLASVSMGYEIGVTALQMATAASIIANGGDLIQPRLVKSVTSSAGVRAELKPHVLRRAILASTAEQLTTIMEGVVARGTATAAQIPGYTIAGKTGTAKKNENGHYLERDYNASFVGFIPSRKPALVILVVIDSPHGSHGYYGGAISAPVFKRIAESAMHYLGIPPTVDAPPVLVAQTHASPSIPSAAAAPAEGVSLVRTAAPAASGPGLVPDVVGLSLREAAKVLVRSRMTPLASGAGVVIQQDPRPGTPVDPGSSCTLTLGRPAPALGSDQRQ